MAKLRIAIVDDHPLMRAGIEATLGAQIEFDVVASGASADDAIAIAADVKPDILLIDVNMPGGGIAACKQITKSNPSARVLFLTVSERHEDVLSALEAGARGYILKGVAGPTLIATIRSVAAGETYITPEFATRLLSSPIANNRSTGDPTEHLTVREEQILREASLGLTNKEIARKLDLSEKTVKHYMSGVLQKLSAKNRTEAVVMSKNFNHDPDDPLAATRRLKGR